jgi:flagellar motor switch protein FliM
MTPGPFDFRKPPPDELVRQVTAWVGQACRRSAPGWARALAYPAELKPGTVEATLASAALAALPDDAVGIAAATPDPADGSVLVVLQRPVLLALLAGIVGETPAALPPDRELTDVEASLIEYLARELFLDPLEKAWPANDPPRLAPGGAAPPRAAWGAATGEPILVVSTTVTTPVGDAPVQIFVPRKGRWERLAGPGAARHRAESAGSADQQIAALVEEMPVVLSVVLGTADLSMHDLTGLGSGDVVILRQKVSQPLDGLVAGKRKFRVWPGAVGTRAGVLIDTRVKD